MKSKILDRLVTSPIKNIRQCTPETMRCNATRGKIKSELCIMSNFQSTVRGCRLVDEY